MLQGKWAKLKVFSSAVGEDKMENVFFMIRGTDFPESVWVVVIAAGTNVIWDSTEKEIVDGLEICAQVAGEKLGNMEVLIESI